GTQSDEARNGISRHSRLRRLGVGMGHRTSGGPASGRENADRGLRKDGPGAASRGRWPMEDQAGDVERGTAAVRRCRRRRQLEATAGAGVGEVVSVLARRKGNVRNGAVHAPTESREKRFAPPAILSVVDLSNLFPHGTVLDFFCEAFEDNRFIGFLIA